MTISEAAELLGIDRTTLSRAARRGTLRAIPSGGIWLVTCEALVEYRDRSRGRPGRKPGGVATPAARRPKREKREKREPSATDASTSAALPADAPPRAGGVQMFQTDDGEVFQAMASGRFRRPNAAEVEGWERRGEAD